MKRVCLKIGEREPIARAEFFLTTKVLYEAGSSGIIEILKTCYRFFPDLVWLPVTNDEQFLIHIAIRYRQEKTFNLFCETKSRNKIASSGLINSETILHLAAKLAPYSQLSRLSGAALQMQREIQWFKVIDIYYKLIFFTFLFFLFLIKKSGGLFELFSWCQPNSNVLISLSILSSYLHFF